MRQTTVLCCPWPLIRAASLALAMAAALMAPGEIWGATQSGLVSDLAISDTVEDELRRDPAVTTAWIDVTTIDGVVTLTGRVDNILARERAARIVETVRGVRAVVNTITVEPPVLRTDEQIRRDVEEALLMDPATEAHEIDVAVRDNVATLAGTVDSWQERDLCATVARGVTGVVGLENDIQVEFKTTRPDIEIQRDIEQGLRWDALVDHALVKVAVNEGRVKLSGTVGSLAEKRRAIAEAYVANAQEVDAEQLEVRFWARDDRLRGDKYRDLSDERVRAAVQDALRYDPRVASWDVKAEVRNHVATLRGSVGNLKAKRTAGATALHTVGVIKVENRLKVRPPSTNGDQAVKEAIQRAYDRDPYVTVEEISLKVENGVVEMWGSVDTFFQKRRAEELASRIGGVVMVHNRIVVLGGLDPYHDPYVEDWYEDRFTYRYDPPMTFKSDWQIKEDIEDEIFWSPFVDAEDVQVAVEYGTAYLTGTVESWAERRAATDNAYDGGAMVVHNSIQVRSQEVGQGG